MNSRVFRNKFLALWLWAIAFGLSNGQEPIQSDTVSDLSGVTISTSVDHAESYVGDLIKYTVGITYDSSFELIPPPLGANLGGFEVKDYEADIKTELDDGRLYSETYFVLSTYIVGEYVIPPVPVQFIAPDSSRKIMLSESVPIKIRSLLEEASDTTDIKGIKAPYEFQRDYTNYYIYGSLALLILGTIGYWYYRRRKNRTDDEVVDPRKPWEIAFEKLAMLKEKKYIEEGAFKSFYIELTELSRECLGRIHDQDILEMTTDEFVATFKEIELPGDLYDRTVSFLRFSDLIKFAKMIPVATQAEDDFLFVHELISDLQSDYERQARLAAATETERAPAAMPAGRNG